MKPLLVLPFILLASCGPRWVDTQQVSSGLPNITFEIKRTGSAACCSNLVAVDIIHSGSREEIARGRRVEKVNIRMIDKNTIALEFCGAAEIDAKLHIPGPVEYDSEGNRDNKTLTVFTSANTTFGNLVFCENG